MDQAVKFHYKFTILGSNDEEITTEDWNVKVLDQTTSFHTLGSWNQTNFQRFVKDDKFTIILYKQSPEIVGFWVWVYTDKLLSKSIHWENSKVLLLRNCSYLGN